MKIQEQIKRDEQIADNTGEYRVITTDELIERLKLPIRDTNVLLSAMEIKGLIAEKLGEVHAA